MSALIEETLSRVRGGPALGRHADLRGPHARNAERFLACGEDPSQASRLLVLPQPPSIRVPLATSSTSCAGRVTGPLVGLPSRRHCRVGRRRASRPRRRRDCDGVPGAPLRALTPRLRPRRPAPPPSRVSPDLIDLVVGVCPSAQVTTGLRCRRSFHARMRRTPSCATCRRPRTIRAEGPSRSPTSTTRPSTPASTAARRRPHPLRRAGACASPRAKHVATGAQAPSPRPRTRPAGRDCAAARDIAPTGGHAPLRPIITNNPPAP